MYHKLNLWVAWMVVVATGLTFSDTLNTEKRTPYTPAVQILGENFAIAGFNYFIRKVDYAAIDLHSIQSNFENGFVWDDNNFNVNQIGHPYQGGLYYCAARNHGFGYRGSLLYAFGGSLQWELFMETEPPALNDLVTTTLGGAMMGEMTGRLAEKLHQQTHGGSVIQIFRGAGVVMINPPYGLHTIVAGKPSRLGNPLQQYPLSLRVATGKKIGGKITGSTGEDGAGKTPVKSVPLASTNLTMEYGSRFECKKAFDYFALEMGLSLLKEPVANVVASGQLWSRVWDLEGQTTHLLALMQNFDFYNSSIYRLGASGFGLEWLSKRRWSNGCELSGKLQLSSIVLGGASTEYYVNIERDYNFGPGAGLRTQLLVRKKSFGHLLFAMDGFWIHSASGAAGNEFITISTAEIQKELAFSVGVALSYVNYRRSGFYRDYPDVSIMNQEFRLMGTYHF